MDFTEALFSSEQCGDGNWPDGGVGVPDDEHDVDVFALVEALDLDEALPDMDALPLICPEQQYSSSLPEAMASQQPKPAAQSMSNSKESERIARMRARNREAQARYRQKSKVRLTVLAMCLQHKAASIGFFLDCNALLSSVLLGGGSGSGGGVDQSSLSTVGWRTLSFATGSRSRVGKHHLPHPVYSHYCPSKAPAAAGPAHTAHTALQQLCCCLECNFERLEAPSRFRCGIVRSAAH